jgi:hypothetical protein
MKRTGEMALCRKMATAKSIDHREKASLIGRNRSAAEGRSLLPSSQKGFSPRTGLRSAGRLFGELQLAQVNQPHFLFPLRPL